MRRLFRRPSHATVVAYLALFVALGGTAMAAYVVSSNSQIGPNTIYGANKPSTANDNIVDGSITSADVRTDSIFGSRVRDGTLTGADLANSIVTGTKIALNAIGTSRVADGSLINTDLADDTLTGTKINEGTLRSVPAADSLGSTYAHEFRPGTAHATQRTDQCAVVQSWRECAPVTLVVPPGERYKVDVYASLTAWGASNSNGFFCAAYEGPSCITGVPTGFTLETNKYLNISHSGTRYLDAGTHRLNAAVRIDGAIGTAPNGMATVTIRWHNYWAEQAAESTFTATAATATAAKAARKPRASRRRPAK